MKKKIRIISLILAAVMLIAAIVSSSLIWLPNALDGKNKQKDAEIDPIEGDSSASQEETVVPPIVPDDSEDKGVVTTRTDLVLDVSQVERHTSPVYIGGSVEQDTKEVPTNEELP